MSFTSTPNFKLLGSHPDSFYRRIVHWVTCVMVVLPCGVGLKTQTIPGGLASAQDNAPRVAVTSKGKQPSQKTLDTDPEIFQVIGEPDLLEKFSVSDAESSGIEVTVKPLPEGVTSDLFEVAPRPGSTSLLPAQPPTPSRKLPAEVTPIPEFGYSPSGLPYRITVGKHDPVSMALIPAGFFLRGTNSAESEAAPEQRVSMDAFYMDVVEVTIERYQTMCAANKKSGRSLVSPLNVKSGPSFPALGVNFSDAQFYAKWVGKELPTEAQWEKAARGVEGGRFPWGNGRPLWSKYRTTGSVSEVGTYPEDVSPYGILDLAGNAREWCRDVYSPSAYREQSAGLEKNRNPFNTKRVGATLTQVVRGGGKDWSVWHRGFEKAATHNGMIGFRCVYNLPTESESEQAPLKK